MSFIFDALKKAESERHRQSGPVLMDVRVAPSRPRLPVWAWILGAVLLANFGVLAWLLLLRQPAAVAPPAAAAVPPVAASQTSASVASQATAAPAAAPVTVAAPTLPSSVPFTAPPAAGTDSLPTMQELQASGISLPSLQLQLHAYDENPASRYVLLNSRRLREGDEVTDGIRVERITTSGVVINAFGRRFQLLAGG